MNLPAYKRFPALLIPLLLGIFLVGTTGFDLLRNMGTFDGKRILETILLSLILGVTLLNPGLRRSFGQLLSLLPRWARYSLVLAGLAGTISALRLSHPGYGLLEVAMLALLSFSILTTGAARRLGGEDFDRLAVIIICTVGLIAVLTEFMGFLAYWVSDLEFSFSNMLVRFFHPRFYNHLQTFSIPLIATLPFVFGASRKLKITAVVLIGLQWGLLLISGGRGSVLSLIGAISLAALLFPSNRRVWLGIHVTGLLLGLLLYFSVLETNQSVNPEGQQLVSESIGRDMTNTNGRFHMWQIGWHQALSQPMLGIGPSRYSCELNPFPIGHPHSFPVTILAEWGFPAFILIIAVCVWLGLRLISKCKQHQNGTHRSDVLVAMLGCSIAAGTAHSLLSGVLIMPAGQVMTILVCGWAAGRLNTTVTQKPASSVAASITLGAATLIALSVTVFSITELQNMDIRTRDANINGPLEPRYWQMGNVCDYRYDGD
jgi:putative inorganic carbon (HCO3(-)) transporter